MRNSARILAHILARVFTLSAIALTFLFVINNFLIHATAQIPALTLGAHLAYPLTLLAITLYVLRAGSLAKDAQKLEALAQYIPRAAFFAVLLIGLVDISLSFLHIEGLSSILPDKIAQGIAYSRYRGTYIHYPLLILGALLALRWRGIPFIWLTLLIVIAELLIVISRFVFSYEQPFMGDLVRFWYAALFLFAAAHTLKQDGHVRIDILYINLSAPAKARVNAIGSLLLGLPLCWVILFLGLAGKNSVINAPILNFEITQSNAGLHVKYFMAAFLLIFALSMAAQFAALLLRSLEQILTPKT
ncbi:MAG: TRAP transporter small permease subunit [Alphaproteobacteria bacterium]